MSLTILNRPLFAANHFQGRPRPGQSPESFQAGPAAADPGEQLRQAARSRATGAPNTYYDAAVDQSDSAKYYSGLSPQAQANPQTFYHALHDLVTSTHTHPLPYGPSTYLYPVVDTHPDGDVESIYSPTKADPDEALLAGLKAKGQATDNVPQPTYKPAGGSLDYNCEHVVPQSWFGKRLPERGDLHHLFACWTKSNSERGNAHYAQLPGPISGEGLADPADNEFEPAAGRGEVARATLYFLLRYPGDIGDKPGEYTVKDLSTLLQWNRENPVTEYEHHRNEAIMGLQGNRNPLVDHPEWADKIDFSLGLAAAAQKAA